MTASRLAQVRFDATRTGPLAQLRVVDLSRLVAGNMLSLQLADFGADVIKVEPRTGDTLRNFRSGGFDTWWKTYARNKRSVAIDFRHPQAREILERLIADADVFVESFRAGVLEAMGLDVDRLLAIRPNLVIVRVSGWGQTGTFREKPGFGTLVEGYSGFAAMNGFADREPVLPPIFLGDMVSGLYGALAVMTAIFEVRVNGGQGQVVDLSLFEPTLAILGPQAANFRYASDLKQRTGSRSSTTAPRNVYRTAEGKWICMSTSTESMAVRMFQAIGEGEAVAQGGKFDTVRKRLAQVDEVDRIVGSFIAGRSLADNLAFFDEMEITAGPVLDASDLLTDDYVISRACLIEVDDPDLGWMPMPNVTPRLSGTPGTLRRPAPGIGENSRDILAPLFGPDRYASLVADAAIFEPHHEGATATTEPA